MKYTINVTRDDIANGTRAVCSKCPVALALQRFFTHDRKWTGIRVTSEYVRFVKSPPGAAVERSLVVELPDAARQFVADFDSEAPVRPFSFTLEIPNNNK